ncbi:glycine-rich protein 5-like [Humulus lupulus]|uniref:glycine-rich protein 5-like n=1 Tax=Humulus lupulus TaxID=3486 RepID=UPI002B415F52|nr:glycine-rich protein 5-like [Humulus lupulus]
MAKWCVIIASLAIILMGTTMARNLPTEAVADNHAGLNDQKTFGIFGGTPGGSGGSIPASGGLPGMFGGSIGGLPSFGGDSGTFGTFPGFGGSNGDDFFGTFRQP